MSDIKQDIIYTEIPHPAGFVHVYRCMLNIEKPAGAEISILSGDEQNRANTYLFEVDHNRYSAAHIFLRKILSQYTQTAPPDLNFAFSSVYNKPMLLDFHNIHFNLSYRGDWALLAVSGNEVGADIEKHIQIDDIDQFARNFFSEKEREWLIQSQNAEVKVQNFFRLWALKEAYIKAIGKGLSFPLQEFSILWEDELPILELPGDRKEYWILKELDACQGYAEAICYKP